MNPAIQSPELMQRVNAKIQTRLLQIAHKLLKQALDALNETSTAPQSATERRRAAARKSLVEVFAPLRGLTLDPGAGFGASNWERTI